MLAAIVGAAIWWFSMAFGDSKTHQFPYLSIPVMLGLMLIGAQLIPLGSGLAGMVAPQQVELYEKYATPVESELLESESQITSPTCLLYTSPSPRD